MFKTFAVVYIVSFSILEKLMLTCGPCELKSYENHAKKTIGRVLKSRLWKPELVYNTHGFEPLQLIQWSVHVF